MARLIRSVARLGLGWILMASGGLASASEPLPLLPQALAPGAWYVQGLSELGSSANQNFISNAGFVVTDDGVVVIDALGAPGLAQRLLDAIRRITPKSVTHVIVTHYHADHIYGLQTFKAAGARIFAHRGAREYLHSDAARSRLEYARSAMGPWINQDTRLVEADQWLDGETRLTLGGVRFIVQPLGPAHTPEDVAVYLPEAKVLFAGDLVFRNRLPFVGQADSRRWLTALDTLLAFDTRAIVPGHGAVTTDGRADLQLTRDYLLHLRTVMGRAARELEPFEDAYKNADWSRFSGMPMFGAANRMNAYNTYLLMEREAP